MRLLRQLGRRKLRTTLTILGITIGVWALVLFGSMANKINSLVNGASATYEGKVAVTDASNSTIGLGISPMRISAWLMRVVLSATRTSQARASSEPPPMQKP